MNQSLILHGAGRIKSTRRNKFLAQLIFQHRTLGSKSAQLKQQCNSSSNQQPDVEATSRKHENRLKSLQLWQAIESFRRHGHRLANLDPLGLRPRESIEQLTWTHRLIEELRTSSSLIETTGLISTTSEKPKSMRASEILQLAESIYVDRESGLEVCHLSDEAEIDWLTSNWELLNQIEGENLISSIERHQLAKLLLECETFDHFMAAKFPTTKRYGCEGAESMLVVFDEILKLCHLNETGSQQQENNASSLLEPSVGLIDHVIIGMPHRGRLNLLVCLLGYEPAQIFNKTLGNLELDAREAWMASGDVLSHLSTNLQFVYGLNQHHLGLSRETPKPINVSLLPNPSHLEISSPMVLGVARGRAHNIHHGYSSSPKFNLTHETRPDNGQNPPEGSVDFSDKFSTILPVQIHGDASVAGQGIIQETLQMSNLPNFSVNGSIHLIVNNQIGYTTEPALGRSSRYSSDVFKLIEMPIVHVNGSNVDSLLRATRLALAYRQKFKKDFAIDLICFRKHGHNELDEPSFTQPIMYRKIRQQLKSIPQLYCDKIDLPSEERKLICDSFKSRLTDAFKQVNRVPLDNENFRNFSIPSELHRDHLFAWPTGCSLEELKQVAVDSVKTPESFSVHQNLKRVLVDDRLRRFASGQPVESIQVDWATAEILAFGSLLNRGHSVRLAGQDVARGTFSTRHAVLFDQATGAPFVPLNNMRRADRDAQTAPKPGAQMEVANTILSEEAALAYEFGYSIETCALTLWEAQFGDFFNTAQSVIDTLVSSSEAKWLRQSALTLLLPHGLDGAGPEHSSSHLERFLQMSSSSPDAIDTEARLNWSVCFPTQPSQYFHLLRRQVLRPFRKPLVVMAPKIIFRHPNCLSNLAEFDLHESFKPVLGDSMAMNNRNSIDTIVLCSGKIYFQLMEERQRVKMENVALIRIEELCPFPIHSILQQLKQFPNFNRNKLIWFQEEHKNQGAFSFVETRLKNLANLKLNYIGRIESELPASGSSVLHKKELSTILSDFSSLKSN